MKLVLRAQNVYSLVLAYMLSFLALLNCGNAILNIVGLHTQLDTVVLFGGLVGLIAIGLTLSVIDRSRFVKLDVIALFILFGASFMISALLDSANANLLFTSWTDVFANPVYVLFLYTLTGYLFARRLTDYECFKKVFGVFSYVVVVISVIVFFFAKGSSASQYMTFSYNMLTQLFFLLVNKPEKHKIFHYITVSLGLFAFVFGGARGALIALILTYLMFYIINHKTELKSIIIYSAGAVAIVVLSLFKKVIFVLIEKFLDALSIESRTFEYLLNEEVLSDSNRINFYKESLNNTGLLGKGLMGDRIILGSYPHNLFLEIFVQYGWILGLVVVLAICAAIGIPLFKKTRAEFIFIIMLFPCGFLKLMMTGSYLNQEPAFYILLGFCVNAIVRSNGDANTNDKHSIRSGQYREDS
ncbi:MAG: O-antigen ligase family protein [Ruminococcaceae bacterium]|nr:O-antigen ligase family protein [Oscillospiraceae bacterium]